MIDQKTIDEVLERSQIEDVISQYVNLKRAGANFKGLSPFKDEKTPSFIVSPAKQIFTCFSSGKSGNVVSFLMEQERYTFPEAIKWLCDRYNIEYVETGNKNPEEQSRTNKLHAINNTVKDHYIQNLQTKDGATIALSYLKENRNFTNSTISKFELGYSIDSYENLVDLYKDLKLSAKDFREVGLIKENEGKEYSFFRGRLMFPIHSISGKIVGFGGRVLNQTDKTAKYINSQESLIYNKSKTLYGLYFSKAAIVKKDKCFIVEGYTDVISMHQSGIENVVASSGTALTVEQVRLIKRYTNNITILYDGDAAGIKASLRGIDLMLAEGITVKVVSFPAGNDPDSYAQELGAEKFLKHIEETEVDAVLFKANSLYKGKLGADDKSKLINELLKTVALMPDQVKRLTYTQSIAKKYEIDYPNLVVQLNKLLRNEAAEVVLETEDKIPRPRGSEYELVRLLVLYGKDVIRLGETSNKVTIAELVVHELETDGLLFTNQLSKDIYEIVQKDVYKYNLNTITSTELIGFISELKLTETAKNIKLTEVAVVDLIYIYKIDKVKEISAEINKAIEAETDEAKLDELLKKQILYETVRGKLAEAIKTIRI